MVFGNKQPQQLQGNGVVVSDNGMGVHVSGEQLREVDAPVEGLVGAMGGAVNAGVIGTAVSAFATKAKEPAVHGMGMFKNVTTSHLPMMAGMVAAGAAIGGFIRYSRAKKQNEWSEKHYQFLEEKAGIEPKQQPASFAEREAAKKEANTEQAGKPEQSAAR